MDRRGWTSEVVDLIGLDIERKGHIVADQIEAVVVDHAIDVAACAGEKVIAADEVGAILEQTLAQMRAEKSGTAGHNYTGFEMHSPTPPQRPGTRNGFSGQATPVGRAIWNWPLLIGICVAETYPTWAWL